jgi:hypothetical protein
VSALKEQHEPIPDYARTAQGSGAHSSAAVAGSPDTRLGYIVKGFTLPASVRFGTARNPMRECAKRKLD